MTGHYRIIEGLMFTRAGLLPSVAHSSAEMMALQNMGVYYDASEPPLHMLNMAGYSLNVDCHYISMGKYFFTYLAARLLKYSLAQN